MNNQDRAAMQMALEAFCKFNQLSTYDDEITALREALAQPQVAPDGRVAKTVFTFEDMQKATEMGYESGKAEAEALAQPQETMDYFCGYCGSNPCSCPAAPMPTTQAAQPQEPVAWVRIDRNGDYNFHGERIYELNSGDYDLYIVPPSVEAAIEATKEKLNELWDIVINEVDDPKVSIKLQLLLRSMQ